MNPIKILLRIIFVILRIPLFVLWNVLILLYVIISYPMLIVFSIYNWVDSDDDSLFDEILSNFQSNNEFVGNLYFSFFE